MFIHIYFYAEKVKRGQKSNLGGKIKLTQRETQNNLGAAFEGSFHQGAK